MFEPPPPPPTNLDDTSEQDQLEEPDQNPLNWNQALEGDIGSYHVNSINPFVPEPVYHAPPAIMNNQGPGNDGNNTTDPNNGGNGQNEPNQFTPANDAASANTPNGNNAANAPNGNNVANAANGNNAPNAAIHPPHGANNPYRAHQFSAVPPPTNGVFIMGPLGPAVAIAPGIQSWQTGAPEEYSNAQIRRAAERCRENPNGPDVESDRILRWTMARLCERITREPDSYNMSHVERSVYTLFQHEYVGNEIARRAVERYWNDPPPRSPSPSHTRSDGRRASESTEGLSEGAQERADEARRQATIVPPVVFDPTPDPDGDGDVAAAAAAAVSAEDGNDSDATPSPPKNPNWKDPNSEDKRPSRD